MQIDVLSRFLTIAAVTVTCVMATPTQAQGPYRVRGKVTAVALPDVTVKTLEGETLELTLGEESEIYSVTPGAIDDIDQEQFVGITSIDAEGVRRIALEVHIFAEDLRGLGEGHYPWDLVRDPNMMTNATIEEITEIEDGPLLSVTYAEDEGDEKREGRQTIQVSVRHTDRSSSQERCRHLGVWQGRVPVPAGR